MPGVAGRVESGGARGRRTRAATDMAGVPATSEDRADYCITGSNGLGKPGVFDPKCCASPRMVVVCASRESVTLSDWLPSSVDHAARFARSFPESSRCAPGGTRAASSPCSTETRAPPPHSHSMVSDCGKPLKTDIFASERHTFTVRGTGITSRLRAIVAGRVRKARPNQASGVPVKTPPRQHFLYFLPLPHGQGSLRPIFGVSRTYVS